MCYKRNWLHISADILIYANSICEGLDFVAQRFESIDLEEAIVLLCWTQ